jgi:hypothetical protein
MLRKRIYIEYPTELSISISGIIEPGVTPAAQDLFTGKADG